MLKNREKIAYIIGIIIILYGAFASRDFSNPSDILEGVLMIAFFIGIFLVFVYINKHGFGFWSPPKICDT